MFNANERQPLVSIVKGIVSQKKKHLQIIQLSFFPHQSFNMCKKVLKNDSTLFLTRLISLRHPLANEEQHIQRKKKKRSGKASHPLLGQANTDEVFSVRPVLKLSNTEATGVPDLILANCKKGIPLTLAKAAYPRLPPPASQPHPSLRSNLQQALSPAASPAPTASAHCSPSAAFLQQVIAQIN